MKRLIAALLITLASTPLALADWNGMKWGTPIKEIMATLKDKGAALKISNPQIDSEVVGDGNVISYITATYEPAYGKTEINFMFDPDENLISILYSLQGDNCTKIQDDFTKSFGTPKEWEPEAELKAAGAKKFEWTDKTDMIDFTILKEDGKDVCSIGQIPQGF